MPLESERNHWKDQKMMQRHERVLLLIDESHRRVRMMKWLTQSSRDIFSPKESERPVDFVLRVAQ